MARTPEPTAVENAYQFLRAAFYRRLAHALSGSAVRDLVRASMVDRGARGIRTPADLLAEVDRIDPNEGSRFRRVLGEFRPKLILNQVRSREEINLGFSIRNVCHRYFGIDLEYLGYVSYDDAVRRSVSEREPLVKAYPQSDGALYIRRIVRRMLGS